MTASSLPQVTLSSPEGARVVITHHGAHVTSWVTPDGRERLFMSGRSIPAPGVAIRGGVPIVFPQFAGLGPLPKHGLVRTRSWELIGTTTPAPDRVAAHFRLRDSAETRQEWDHAFLLDFTVTVGGPALELHLQVTNPGTLPFSFMAALHTYLRVDAIDAVTVAGLGGRPYREAGADGVQSEALLHIAGEVDRIYWRVPGPILLREGDQMMTVTATGFPDAVVWNPGPERAATIPDLEPEGYRRMLCIEAALIGAPVSLLPGGVWTGVQTLRAESV
jgi:glucose-6-phosphate 1-epimerase